jgi:hypothetical protein
MAWPTALPGAPGKDVGRGGRLVQLVHSQVQTRMCACERHQRVATEAAQRGHERRQRDGTGDLVGPGGELGSRVVEHLGERIRVGDQASSHGGELHRSLATAP